MNADVLNLVKLCAQERREIGRTGAIALALIGVVALHIAKDVQLILSIVLPMTALFAFLVRQYVRVDKLEWRMTQTEQKVSLLECLPQEVANLKAQTAANYAILQKLETLPIQLAALQTSVTEHHTRERNT